jgi:hypothetical protein
MGGEGVNRAPTKMSPALGGVLWLFFFATTFGLLPILRVFIGGEERRRRDALFRHGTFSRGTVVAVSAASQTSSRVTFEFDAGGERLQATETVVSQDASHMLEGDAIGVLFDPADPANNTVVYR